jgi:peptide/nickel transport system substrate-binding protein
LAFGISPNQVYDRPDFFEDVRVRQGIARCIDRQALAEQMVGTSGRVLDSYLPPEHPFYAGEEIATWAYDPEAGRALLTEAGWYDGDGDGVREAHGIPGVAEGTPFRVTYRTADDALRTQTAQAVQAYLTACGIQSSVETASSDAFFAPGPEGPLFGRRFELAQFSWRVTSDPLCDLFLSGRVPGAGRWDGPNVAGFLDDEYDMACLSALEAWPGSSEYSAGQAEAQRIFSRRLPVLPLFQRPKVTFARAAVIGLAPNPTQVSELWNIEQLDLRP